MTQLLSMVPRFLSQYDRRMQWTQRLWLPALNSDDEGTRKGGVEKLYDTHVACVEGALRAIYFWPNEFDGWFDNIALAHIADRVGIPADEIAFAALARDTISLSSEADRRFLETAGGVPEADEGRAIDWCHDMLGFVSYVSHKIQQLSPRVEALANHPGTPNLLSILGMSVGKMDAASEHIQKLLSTYKPY